MDGHGRDHPSPLCLPGGSNPPQAGSRSPRVSGTVGRGQDEEEDAIVAAIRAGWKAPDQAFRKVFSALSSRMARLENAQEMCVPDLPANIAATQRFLRACTSRPLGDDEAAAALAWNMVVPSAVRGALLSRELDGSDVLANVSVPVLVTHGQDDAIVLPSMAEHTLTVCPAATASRYDGVGHMPFWEAPHRFDRELADLARAARSPLPVRPEPR